jgi:hypothetical protein
MDVHEVERTLGVDAPAVHTDTASGPPETKAVKEQAPQPEEWRWTADPIEPSVPILPSSRNAWPSDALIRVFMQLGLHHWR